MFCDFCYVCFYNKNTEGTLWQHPKPPQIKVFQITILCQKLWSKHFDFVKTRFIALFYVIAGNWDFWVRFVWHRNIFSLKDCLTKFISALVWCHLVFPYIQNISPSFSPRVTAAVQLKPSEVKGVSSMYSVGFGLASEGLL